MKKILVVGVILLFLGSSIPVLAQSKGHPRPLSHILYVGGSGPGNYSTIQDAINASSNGDTVFIYEKPPCYFENIIINKSITLIGENHNVSVESKNWSLYTIRVIHDSVKIDGVNIAYIPNPWEYSSLGFSVENSSFVNISNSHLCCGQTCINFYKVTNSSIFHDVFDFVETYLNMVLTSSDKNNIQDNLFYNHFGKDLVIDSDSSDNVVQNNNFSWPIHPGDTRSIVINSNAGIGNTIIHNNIYPEIVCNVKAYWYRNYYESSFRYWGRYPLKEVDYRILSLFLPMVLWNHNWREPVFNVDLRPAFRPYDIPTMNEQGGR